MLKLYQLHPSTYANPSSASAEDEAASISWQLATNKFELHSDISWHVTVD